MSRRINAPRESADDSVARVSEPRRQALRLGQTVGGGMTSANNGDGECIDGPNFATHEKDAGRIMNILERAGICRCRFEQQRNLLLAAKGDLLGDVDFPLGRRQSP